MTTKNMLIIKDESGKIIAAQVEETADSEVTTFISPAHESHTLHRVHDVPEEIHNLTHPDDFHKAITKHVESGDVKINKTSADELHAALAAKLNKAKATVSS
jgi:hypothetical protein